MTITRNHDGSYSAFQRAPNGTACVAEATTRTTAIRACCRLALTRGHYPARLHRALARGR